METVRIFFDHLFFSLVSVFVVLLVLSIAAGGLITGFSLTDHPWAAALVWILASLGLAAALTYSSIKNKPSDRAEFTRRRY